MPILVFSIIFFLILAILIFSLILFYKDRGYVAPEPVKKVKKAAYKTLYECGIEELANRIATEDLNDQELLRVVSMVAKSHKFPGKSSGKDSEHHLRFIHQFCLNENANGNTIVKMSNTLKAVNTEYSSEIDGTQQYAVKIRDEKAENEKKA